MDGTNIVRSFAAKGREFRFPLDVVDKPVRLSGNPATRVVEHVETMFPAWKKQREILKVLLEERRARRTAQANKNKKQSIFNIGDLVIVQHQVQSNCKQGRPAKMAIKGQGPYRVVGKAGKDSYRVQKIPAVASVTLRPSPIRK
jgi:hypothetical protein